MGALSLHSLLYHNYYDLFVLTKCAFSLSYLQHFMAYVHVMEDN